MKKLILTSTILYLILSAAIVFSSPAMKQLQTGLASVCTKDTFNLVMDESTMSSDSIPLLSANAVGQSVSYGSAWSLYSIETRFAAATSSCVYTVRIGTSSDLTTYVEEIANQSAPDGGGLHEALSVAHDSYNTAYIGYVEVSGDCRILKDDTSPPYSGGTYYAPSSGWILGGSTAADLRINVYKCQ